MAKHDGCDQCLCRWPTSRTTPPDWPINSSREIGYEFSRRHRSARAALKDCLLVGEVVLRTIHFFVEQGGQKKQWKGRGPGKGRGLPAGTPQCGSGVLVIHVIHQGLQKPFLQTVQLALEYAANRGRQLHHA